MNGLDLYSKVEPFLGFEEEVHKLYKAFLLQLLDKGIKNVLDVGCGQGYFLETLGLNGIKAKGIDLSSAQVEACKAKGLDAGHIDLCDLEEDFEALTAVFDVINYLPKEHLKNFFSCACNRVKKDGYFIFDVNSLYGFEEIAQGSLNIDLDEKFIAIDAEYEKEELNTKITLFERQNGLYCKEQGTITQYYHSKDRLKKILKNTGFKIDEIVPFNLHSTDESDKQIWICRK